MTGTAAMGDVARVIGELSRVVDGILAHAQQTDRALRESAEDVRADVLSRVLQKVRDDEEVEDLEGYVAALTRNRIHDFVRARFPERTRLKQRIRFLLNNDERFATWNGAAGVLCGFEAWRGRRDVAAVPMVRYPRAVFDASQPAAALAALFESAGAPFQLDELISLLMDVWSIAEASAVDVVALRLADARPSPVSELETRAFLEALWSEIAALRPLQRAALLLNLRDHENGNALTLFLLLGIADFDAIAAAAGLTAAELAELWCALPLDDATIAARLGVTRQQVINLRKSARERLRRRLRS